jgi:hypothetical protein
VVTEDPVPAWVPPPAWAPPPPNLSQPPLSSQPNPYQPPLSPQPNPYQPPSGPQPNPYEVPASAGPNPPPPYRFDEPPRGSDLPPERSNRLPVIVVGAALVLILLLAGGVWLLTRGSSKSASPTAGAGSSSVTTSASASATSTPTTSAPVSSSAGTNPQQVAAANSLKSIADRSGSVRASVQPAITAISGCGDIAGAVAALTNAAKVRGDLVPELSALNVSALPSGRALVAALDSALKESAEADKDYAAWGTEVTGCTAPAPKTANYTSATQHDPLATSAKQTFAAEWAKIAPALGLPAVDAGKI